MIIGERLKSLRQLTGMSQRELAKKAGVANATVSMIERDQISPSVSSLKSLLDALDISMGRFFSLEDLPEEKIVYKQDELVTINDGQVTFRQVGRNLQGRALQMLHETYAAGGDTGEPMLSHQSEEAGIIIKGIIELTVGDQVHRLSAGDAYYFNSRIPHRFRNLDQEDCEIVSVCTPPSF
tara:strand:- start:1397 stop:1939 length:543 start_codon:yes stop_codon:yes gene_type:complete